MPLPRKELADALVNAFDSVTFDRMLSDHLNIRRDRLVAGTGLVGFDAIVSGIVQIADERRWVIDLIRAAFAANPGNPALFAFVARNSAYDPQSQPASVQNCFFSVFMRARRVFLRRDEFRDKLQMIGSTNESRVMAIDGDRFTGKTYSQDFLSFLLENEPAWAGVNHQIQYVNMDDRVFEPEDLARVIGTRLGLDPTKVPPDKGEQAARRIPDLIDWLIVGFQQNFIHPPVDIWWLILDGFRIQVQPPATHDFIRALIDMVERYINRVRLILLNYSTYLDLDISVYILTESIKPIDEKKDVSEFFRHVYTLSKKSFTDADIDQTVTNVLEQVDREVTKRGPGERMKLLSLGLTKAASELLK